MMSQLVEYSFCWFYFIAVLCSCLYLNYLVKYNPPICIALTDHSVAGVRYRPDPARGRTSLRKWISEGGSFALTNEAYGHD